MKPPKHLGFFGKLLSRGDFVSRGLPTELREHWDCWMQHGLLLSQQRLGPRWLELYLTSPVWHFVWRPGVVDASAWTGLYMPSVDRVGRHFPLLLATSLETSEQGETFADWLTHWQQWHSQAQQHALSSLTERLDPDSLASALAHYPLPSAALHLAQGGTQALLRSDVHLPFAALSSALKTSNDERIRRAGTLWWTEGSAQIAPCLLLCQGLPDPQHFHALLDGDWQDWASGD